MIVGLGISPVDAQRFTKLSDRCVQFPLSTQLLAQEVMGLSFWNDLKQCVPFADFHDLADLAGT